MHKEHYTAVMSMISDVHTASESVLCCSRFDANGNVCDLTGTNGSSLAHYEYGPFGQKTASSGALADANPWQFSTKYFDEGTELSYYGFRYYHPEMGRWVNRDPAGERHSSNLLRMMFNSTIGKRPYDRHLMRKPAI